MDLPVLTPDEIVAFCRREELIDINQLTRGLGKPRKQILRDWLRRQHPVTRIGRDVLLSCALVLSTYFPHRSFPDSANHSGLSGHDPR